MLPCTTPATIPPATIAFEIGADTRGRLGVLQQAAAFELPVDSLLPIPATGNGKRVNDNDAGKLAHSGVCKQALLAAWLRLRRARVSRFKAQDLNGNGKTKSSNNLPPRPAGPGSSGQDYCRLRAEKLCRSARNRALFFIINERVFGHSAPSGSCILNSVHPSLKYLQGDFSEVAQKLS